MFRVGERVRKKRVYSQEKYCLYGGEPYQVPIGTAGTIFNVLESGNRIEVMFDNGVQWSVHVSEVGSILSTNSLSQRLMDKYGSKL